MQPPPPLSTPRNAEADARLRPPRPHFCPYRLTMPPLMLIALTTVDSQDIATQLAQDAVAAHLAVCAQVEGPLMAYYHWAGRLTSAREWRVVYKLLPAQSAPLREWVHHSHPYATPQWLVQEVAEVGEKYLSWARATPTSINF
jgi:periplasmic divalent cation tolerance protein